MTHLIQGARTALCTVFVLFAWGSTLWAQETSASNSATSPSTPPSPTEPSGAWYDGVIEGNFVVVSVFVGVVVCMAALYLMRRLLPPSAGGTPS